MIQAPDPFDPYYHWLGIPPSERPVSYYRLLGIREFEDNIDVIANAADRCMAHIRTFQGGIRFEISQQILNELASARICLLDSAQKLKYDTAIMHQRRAAKRIPKPPRERTSTQDAELASNQDNPIIVVPRTAHRSRGRTTGRGATGIRRRKLQEIGRTAAVVTLLVILSVMIAIGYHVLQSP